MQAADKKIIIKSSAMASKLYCRKSNHGIRNISSLIFNLAEQFIQWPIEHVNTKKVITTIIKLKFIFKITLADKIGFIKLY